MTCSYALGVKRYYVGECIKVMLGWKETNSVIRGERLAGKICKPLHEEQRKRGELAGRSVSLYLLCEVWAFQRLCGEIGIKFWLNRRFWELCVKRSFEPLIF